MISIDPRLSIITVVIVTLFDFILSDELPKFTREPQSVFAKHHGKVVLHCAVQPPTAEIQWKYNGNFITTNEDEGMLINGGTLHIKSFKHSKRHKPHAGKYQCVVNTTFGAIASLPAEVTKASIDKFEQDAPSFVINATEGNVALVPCTPPESFPPAVITFEVNSTLIDSEYSVRHKILPSGSLQIENVRHIDQGTYTCRAKNPVTGQIRVSSQQVTLRVLNPVMNKAPSVVKMPPQKTEVIAGSNLTLECVVNGAPVPVVTWDKYGGILPEDRYSQILGNLLIYDVQVQDSGTYICRGENGLGKPPASIAMVDVLEMPEISRSPEDQTVIEGDDVSFECEASGKPKVKTSWLYNARPVYRDSAVSITETMLTLHQVNLNQGGFYQCVAQSRIGTATAVARLRVKKRRVPIAQDKSSVDVDKDGATVKPQAIAPDHEPSHNEVDRPTITVGPSNTTVTVGQTVTLLCITEAARLVNWLKDAVPIDYALNERHDVLTTGSLHIYNVHVTDSGEYTCVASNKLGFATSSAYVIITDSSPRDRNRNFPDQKVEIETKDTSSQSPPTTTPEGATFTNNSEDGTNTLTVKKTEERLTKDNQTEPNDGGHDNRDILVDLIDYNYDTDEVVQPPTDSPSQTMPPFGVDGGRRKKNRKQKDRARERGHERDNDHSRDRGRSRKKKKNRSGEVKMVPPSKPRVKKLSDNSVMLSWTVEDNDGLRIIFFRVQYRELNSKKKRGGWETIEEDIAGEDRQYEVAGLKPGATYKFRIAAVYSNNDNKPGPISERFRLSVEPAHRPNRPVGEPVIVEAKSVSSSAVAIRWKYQPLGTVAVEGFIIYYRPYDRGEDFQKQIVWGRDLVNHILTQLQPDTEYEIMMKCFNTAGESDVSNTVVKRTLSFTGLSGSANIPVGGEYTPIDNQNENPFTSTKRKNKNNDRYDTKTYDIDQFDSDSKVTTNPTHEYDDKMGPKPNTQSSSMLLYMVLGIVLGVMMLLLVIFMVMCGLKQRQERRMMAEFDANMRHKFHDPAQRIHNDNVRKKFMNGGFALNTIHQNGVISNGTLQNGHLPNQESGSKINISVNPISQLDQHFSEPNGKIQSNGDLAHNLHEILSADGIYNSLERQSTGPPSQHGSHDERGDLHTYNGNHRTRQSTFKPEPPDPSRIPNRIHDQHNPNYELYDHLHSCSRSHDQLPQPPYDYIQRSQDYHSLDQGAYTTNNLPPSDSQHVRHKKRRRSRDRERDRDRGHTRDMATNTDYSSNDGTLDQHSLTYRSLDTLRREEAYHRRSPIVCPDIPQVHDYSDYNFE